MTWTLVISILYWAHGVALTSVPGFATEAACQSAALSAERLSGPTTAYRAVCVQVR